MGSFAVYICGSGSFTVEFRDHLQSVVISDDVQFLFFFLWGGEGTLEYNVTEEKDLTLKILQHIRIMLVLTSSPGSVILCWYHNLINCVFM